MTFVKGLELSRLFYFQAVRPILEAQFPGLSHSAALIGSGSEVLGFDTDLSSDHHWGPRVMLFIQPGAGPQVLQASGWQERQEALGRAYELAGKLHNRLGITPPLPAQVSKFHGRPFPVIHGEVFAEAIASAIQDAQVRALPAFAGSVNQFLESVDVLDNLELCRRLQEIYLPSR